MPLASEIDINRRGHSVLVKPLIHRVAREFPIEVKFTEQDSMHSRAPHLQTQRLSNGAATAVASNDPACSNGLFIAGVSLDVCSNPIGVHFEGEQASGALHRVAKLLKRVSQDALYPLLPSNKLIRIRFVMKACQIESS